MRKYAHRRRHDYEDADFAGLLGLLAGPPCAVMALRHPTALWDELLGGWRSCRFRR